MPEQFFTSAQPATQIEAGFIDLIESGCFIKRDGNLLVVRVMLTKQPLLFSIHIADYNVILSPTTTSRTSREINELRKTYMIEYLPSSTHQYQ